MKDGIHPVMHAKARTTCTNCSAVYDIPSTVETLTVETCRACHPVYTGKKQTTRTGGRIDRFKARLDKASK